MAIKMFKENEKRVYVAENIKEQLGEFGILIDIIAVDKNSYNNYIKYFIYFLFISLQPQVFQKHEYMLCIASVYDLLC